MAPHTPLTLGSAAAAPGRSSITESTAAFRGAGALLDHGEHGSAPRRRGAPRSPRARQRSAALGRSSITESTAALRGAGALLEPRALGRPAEELPQLDLGALQAAALGAAQRATGAVHVEVEHRHRRPELRALRAPAAQRRALQPARDRGRRALEDAARKVHGGLQLACCIVPPAQREVEARELEPAAGLVRIELERPDEERLRFRAIAAHERGELGREAAGEDEPVHARRIEAQHRRRLLADGPQQSDRAHHAGDLGRAAAVEGEQQVSALAARGGGDRAPGDAAALLVGGQPIPFRSRPKVSGEKPRLRQLDERVRARIGRGLGLEQGARAVDLRRVVVPGGEQLALERRDLVPRLERVAEEGGAPEARRLLDEGDDGRLDDRRERRGADGRHRAQQQAVGEPAAVARRLRVLVVVVDRVSVAGHAGEEHEVRVGERPGWALEAVAEREVVEPALGGHQSRQNTSATSAAVRATKIAGRARAANGRPSEYHARCFLSCTSAPRSGRCASTSVQWRRMIAARAPRDTSTPREIHRPPRAPRPIMTEAQPVAATIARASSTELTSPLPTTGMRTASTTSAITSHGARPVDCWLRERGCTETPSTPSLSASRAISGACTPRSSQPPRILMVNVPATALRSVRKITAARSGSRIRAAPCPLATTFATGQPMLRSIPSAPAVSSRRAASASRSGSSPSNCIARGRSSGRYAVRATVRALSRTSARASISSLVSRPAPHSRATSRNGALVTPAMGASRRSSALTPSFYRGARRGRRAAPPRGPPASAARRRGAARGSP